MLEKCGVVYFMCVSACDGCIVCLCGQSGSVGEILSLYVGWKGWSASQ